MLRRGTLAAYAVSFVAVAALAVAPALADILIWQGAPGGDWNVASNWYNQDTSATATQPPGSFDAAFVNAGGQANLSSSGAAVYLSIGTAPGNPGRLLGYGDLAVETLVSSGEVVAYGGGQQQTLDLGSAYLVENPVDNAPGETNGWYAFQGGRLELPTLPGSGGTWWWGEDPAESGGDDVPDMINSMRIYLPADLRLTVSLLAEDRQEVPAGTTGTLAIWNIDADTGQGPWQGQADLQVRYDDYTIFGNSLDETNLRFYRFTGGAWVDVTGVLDLATQTIGTEEFTSSGLYAIGFDVHADQTTEPAVPEPASLALLMAGMGGLGGYLRRRAGR